MSLLFRLCLAFIVSIGLIACKDVEEPALPFEGPPLPANFPAPRYDYSVRGESGGSLTAEELEGLEIFKAKCSSCHATDLFTTTRSATTVSPMISPLTEAAMK